MSIATCHTKDMLCFTALLLLCHGIKNLLRFIAHTQTIILACPASRGGRNVPVPGYLSPRQDPRNGPSTLHSAPCHYISDARHTVARRWGGTQNVPIPGYL